MGRNSIGGQFIQSGTIRTSGSDRCLHHTLRTYWLITLTTPETGLNLRVSGTSHSIIVSLCLAFLVAQEVVQMSYLEGVLDVSRLLYPLYPGRKAGD